AVPAPEYIEVGLDLAVDQVLVAQMAVGLEDVERRLARAGIDQQVGEDDRNVELRKTRQPEAGVLVTGVIFVEQDVKSGQPLVDIFGGMAFAVVVIPQRSLRFTNIAVGRSRVGE